MWQKPMINHLLRRAVHPLLFTGGCIVLIACGGNQAEEAPVVTTPIATVAPNARALPDETTVVEAAPLIGTAEVAATDIAESVDADATDVAQELDQEATEIVSSMQEQQRTADALIATPNDAEVSPTELRSYLGQSVAIRGSITQLLGPHSFLMRDPAILDGEEALVIYDQADLALAEGQNLLVGGEVRQFDLDALESSTGLDLPDAQLMALQTDLVLVAQSITQTP
jgi:hypothetical protein